MKGTIPENRRQATGNRDPFVKLKRKTIRAAARDATGAALCRDGSVLCLGVDGTADHATGRATAGTFVIRVKASTAVARRIVDAFVARWAQLERQRERGADRQHPLAVLAPILAAETSDGGEVVEQTPAGEL